MDNGPRTTDFIIATLVINFDGTVYSQIEVYPNLARYPAGGGAQRKVMGENHNKGKIR